VILELRRTGGLTGGAKHWRVDAGDDPAWRALVDAAGLQYSSGLGRALRFALIWMPGGGAPNDAKYDLWVDGRRATIHGFDVIGAKHDLLDRIMREGDDSPAG